MASPPPPPPNFPFLFPAAESTVLPDPSPFFSPPLLSTPLPTNSFFQNFTLKNGDVPEYIHPYLVKLSPSSLSLSFPSRFSGPAFLYQVFTADLAISAADHGPSRHLISSFSDLSLTLDYPDSNLTFFLLRGSPFLTCSVSRPTPIAISTVHAVLSVTPNASFTRHALRLNNNQTWIIYTSSSINLSHDLSSLTSAPFSGTIRIAVLPDASCGPDFESILDRFSSSYAISGDASFSKPFCVEYKWQKRGWGDLLMLAHPLHLRLLSRDDCDCPISVLDGFRYSSIDGDLVGVVGDSWMLKPDPVSITWHSLRGVPEESYADIVSALNRDVEGLNSAGVTTTSSYFYGKTIARAARLLMIAEELRLPEVVPRIWQFLKETIEPWLDGTFNGNGFLYDSKWGGIVTKQGCSDPGADFGFGVYNDHHYHLGYFIYAIAVLAKIDPAWGRMYKSEAYALMADFMSLGQRSDSNYPRLRCFDLYKLHSWAGGLTEFADGRNQESTSEAVNAYYSAALMGLAYEDSHLRMLGTTLTSMEIEAAKTWWQVREDDRIYGEDFTRENRVVGVLWANKRDSGLSFAPPEWKECRLGIQLLPLLPITEVLFSDVQFVRELVSWCDPALAREGVREGWKGFVYALQAVYDREGALDRVRNLQGHDDGNSLSNLLWWIHSRMDEEEYGCKGGKKLCMAEDRSCDGTFRLPADFTEDLRCAILQRLPTEILLELVSPWFCKTIKDPSFVASHFEISSAQPVRLLFLDKRRHDAIRNEDTCLLLKSTDGSDELDVVPYGPIPSGGSCFSQSAGGLFCFDTNGITHIYNPTIGTTMSVTHPGCPIDDCYCRSLLGYDPVEKKHKIIVSRASDIYVYTLGKGPGEGVWRRNPGVWRNNIEEGRGDLTFMEAICINGLMHILCDKQKRPYLLLFDLGPETFKVFPIPFRGFPVGYLVQFGGTSAFLQLGGGDELSLLHTMFDGEFSEDLDEKEVCLAVLEDTERGHYITKSFVQPSVDAPDSESDVIRGVTLEGDVVYTHPSDYRGEACLFLYNFESGRLQKVKLSKLRQHMPSNAWRQGFQVTQHVESLYLLGGKY